MGSRIWFRNRAGAESSTGEPYGVWLRSSVLCRELRTRWAINQISDTATKMSATPPGRAPTMATNQSAEGTRNKAHTDTNPTAKIARETSSRFRTAPANGLMSISARVSGARNQHCTKRMAQIPKAAYDRVLRVTRGATPPWDRPSPPSTPATMRLHLRRARRKRSPGQSWPDPVETADTTWN